MVIAAVAAAPLTGRDGGMGGTVEEDGDSDIPG